MIVVTTPDVVGERMAGPGIRAWNLARQLSGVAETVLIAKSEDASPAPTVQRTMEDRQPCLSWQAGLPALHLSHGSAEAEDALKRADILIGQPARGFRKRRRDQKVIYDLFDPTVLELRELYGNQPSMRQRIHLGAEWTRLAFALGTADVLMCAAPQQRKFYAQLQSNDAPWIEVPFGIDLAETKVCEKPHDNIVIWGGGTWEWLDPATAVEAVIRVNELGVRCRLLFLGRTRPNRSLVDRRRENRFDQLIERGGNLVSANAEWVPYRERLSWLRSGKVAIMLHRPTAEAQASIRTRLFDAIAAGVPLVSTEGGFASELIEREGLGVVVPAGDVSAVAEAIRRLLEDDVFHSSCVLNLERVRPRFAWEVVTRPLIEVVTSWLKRR